MRSRKKSKLLSSIDKIIDNYEIKSIKVTQSQFDNLLKELYAFSKNKHEKMINYRGRLIEIIEFHDVNKLSDMP